MKNSETEEPKQDDYGRVAALQAAQSPEAREQSLAALGEIGDKYLTVHEGLDAEKALAEFDERAKRADAEIRKVYGPNTRAYQRYSARHANAHAAQRKALASAVAAEMKHGAQVAMKTDTENRINTLIETDSLDAAGVTANQAADGEIASESFNSMLSQTDSENDAAKMHLEEEREQALESAKTDEEKKSLNAEFDNRKAAIDNLSVGTKAALGGMAIEELTGITKMEEMHARGRAIPLRNELRNIFMQRYKAHRAMNQSHEIAYANAIEAARQGAITYFSERIKRGQVGHVLYMLDELEKIGDDDFQKSKTDKTPVGVYDPSAYGFCRKSDLSALRKAAIEQINSFERMSKLKMSIDKAKHDLQQDRLEQAVNIWKGDVRLKIARGELSTMSSPEEMLSQFLPEIKKFQDAGYEKVDELVSSITASCNGFFKLREDTKKRYDAMSKAVRQADFAERIAAYEQSEADNVAMTYLLPDRRVAINNTVDRRAALVAFIDVALKDETIDDSVKAVYNEKKEKLQAERVKRNADALKILASRCGWRLPTEQTKHAANYTTGMYVAIEGMPSRQTGDSLLFKPDGSPVISNEMTATWTDPENPNLKMTLGASEVRDLFENAMSMLDQTPEDDFSILTNPNGGVKSRVEVAFLNALRTAAREKNAKDVYSALSGAMRTMDDSLFSRSVRTSTYRMDYMHNNAFIPPVVVKRDDAKKSEK